MNPKQPTLRALVVDDSALYRKIVSNSLSVIPGVEVVATANNGRIALDKIEQFKPDFLTLDLEMPELDGIGLLKELSSRNIDLPVIMISSLTTEGAQATTTALRLGAFDFVLKPHNSSSQENDRLLQEELKSKLQACRLLVARNRASRSAKAAQPTKQSQNCAARSLKAREVPNRVLEKSKLCKAHPEIVVIGISTGGPHALSEVLPRLPADLPCPVLIVQHMPVMFTKTLADDLNRHCRLKVREANHDEPVLPGQILIAPGGKQMKITQHDDLKRIVITDDPPVRFCKPSVDYLFDSIASIYGPNAMGVIMTGMGDDGTAGCKRMHGRGATILAQDEASCVVYGMPQQVAESGVVDIIAPLSEIASKITSTVCRGVVV